MEHKNNNINNNNNTHHLVDYRERWRRRVAMGVSLLWIINLMGIVPPELNEWRSSAQNECLLIIARVCGLLSIRGRDR